jgi:hypothetical protein
MAKIRIYAKRKRTSIEEVFKDDVTLVEEETSKERYFIIELKDFIDKLDNVMGFELKELEVYCLYTKLKFDEVENDLEAISYDKLLYELENEENKRNDGNIKSQIVSNKVRMKNEDLFEEKEKRLSLMYTSGFKVVKASSKVEDSKNNNDNDNNSKAEGKEDKYIGIKDCIDRIIVYMKDNKTTLADIKNKINNECLKIEKLNNELIRIGIIDGLLIKTDFSEFVIEEIIDLTKLFDYFKSIIEENEGNDQNSHGNVESESFKVNININQSQEKINSKQNDIDEFDKKSESSFDKELNEALMNMNED